MPEVTNATEKQCYLDDFEELRQRAEPDWLKSFRGAGLKRFEQLEFPHRKQEDWRFTNVNPIIRTPFRSLLDPQEYAMDADAVAPHLFHEPEWIELVFVDGFFAPDLSRNLDGPGGVRVGSLGEDMASDAEALRAALGSCLNGSGNVYNALNSALLMDGSVVRIPRGSVTCPPIHVLFITTGRDGSTAVHPRNLIVAEELTRSTLIESYVNVGGGERFNNVVTEIDLGAGAGMTRFKLLNEGPNGYHLATTKVRQDRDSRFTSFSFFLGGKIARNELSVTLDEEGAECSLNGLYLAEQKQLVDSANAIEHKAPHCSSRIAFKGVLDGKSRAVFSGKVHVHRGAQKTDSNQLNQNLLLSDEATVDTKPLLEIFADDVKCTHGATVGRPPREQIFYLQSRGLSEAMARAVLTYGFADEVVREVDIEPLRKRLDKVVFDRYSPR